MDARIPGLVRRTYGDFFSTTELRPDGTYICSQCGRSFKLNEEFRIRIHKLDFFYMRTCFRCMFFLDSESDEL